MTDTSLPGALAETRPTWRGWIHTVAFPVALVLGIVLLLTAEGTAAITGSAIFFMASLALFGISALYHRIGWSPGVKAIFRRIDHANIFLLIAGTYTPITLLCLPRDKATILLATIWTGALLGIVFRIFWLGAPRWLYVGLYVLLGWAAMVFVADFFRASWSAMTLILLGGVAYSIGAAIYGLKRPNPLPTRFGFHEIFHVMTVIAFGLHWAGVYLVTSQPPILP